MRYATLRAADRYDALHCGTLRYVALGVLQDTGNRLSVASSLLPQLLSARRLLLTLLDLCVSSLHRGHADLLRIVPILTDGPRRESIGEATFALRVC